MKETTTLIGGRRYRTLVYDTVVIGTGCAGYNCAARLHAYGRTDVAIITEGVKLGTSRNTGSDKQTYYKLTLSGGEPDSVLEMARTLFAGQCVDGDHALCEAALSAGCFIRLAQLGVQFPVNRYGEYIGYKTDHDPKCRATSAGPLTSKQMTEALEKDVASRGIAVYDEQLAVALLTGEAGVRGVMCLDMSDKAASEPVFTLFLCSNAVLATGGPAGIYRDIVYPYGHNGMSSLAFEAGALGKNLTEWQYGLASVQPRWNVSGTYMQVLPRFISVDGEGIEREFLTDYIDDPGELLTDVFLKGYQWPFDSRKAIGGSSLIDLIVYNETCVLGRKVYLDYRENPLGDRFSFEALSDEAHTYLQRAEALFGKPIDRLKHMNMPAYEFYRDRGVDLESQRLQVAVCAQHNNGGVSIDGWWQTAVRGLFTVGEAAASHGVYRPGGSALNAGQVGSERAARYISAQPARDIDADETAREIANQVNGVWELAKNALLRGAGKPDSADVIKERLESFRREMSAFGGPVRNAADIGAQLQAVRAQLSSLPNEFGVEKPRELYLYFRLRDTLISQLCYLSAMEDYVKQGGLSRGSALYTDPAGVKPLDRLPESCRHIVAQSAPADDPRVKAIRNGQLLQEVRYRDGQCECSWRSVRPIPDDDEAFENVWRVYRENGNVY